MEMDPYEILGLSSKASKDQIKLAWRELSKEYHPDKHNDNSEEL